MIFKSISTSIKINWKGIILLIFRNIEEYLKLVNSLQVTNNQKKKKYDTLQVSYHQMNIDRMEKSLKLSRISDWDGAK